MEEEEYLKSKFKEFKTSMSFHVVLTGHEIKDLIREFNKLTNKENNIKLK